MLLDYVWESKHKKQTNKINEEKNPTDTVLY